ncbi:MAG: TerD family protein [Synergistaceae bacterium]|nr:TerD family protein [Synergistaceae bacterium]
MNIIAFLFAIVGAALNMFQPVINAPVSGSVFTGSMYDAFIVIANHISKNGLPGGDGAVGAMLIFMILCLVPVIAAVHGIYVLFRKSRYASLNLFLCALVDALIAAGLFYVSPESFSSTFFADYIIPYAQKISFITPAIWALCYLIASVFTPSIKTEPGPVIIDKPTKPINIEQGQKVNIKPVVLEKGQEISIIEVSPGISRLYFGLGWTVNERGGASFDLDASAFMITANNNAADGSDLIYYNNLRHSSGAFEHSPDDYKGGNGIDDNEWITVDLNKLPSTIKKIVFTVTIHDADKRNQNFGQVSNTFVRVADYDTETDTEKKVPKREYLRYYLREKFSTETAVIIAELSRDSGRWIFSARGEGVKGGLGAICEKFGFTVVDTRR